MYVCILEFQFISTHCFSMNCDIKNVVLNKNQSKQCIPKGV